MDGYAPTAEPAAPPASKRRAWTPERAPTELRQKSWRARLTPWRGLLLVVLLPTLLVAGFEYLVAADQYESEAHFILRGAQPSGGGGGLGQLLGLGGAAPNATEAYGVSDYLLSHDAVAAARRTLDLPTLFRRPEADPLTRLWSGHPQPETLLKYYRRQVDVRFDADTGITRLSVKAFRPADARDLAETLLRLGEARINTLNQRSFDNGLSVARRQLAEAEAGVAASQATLTGFRQSGRDIDPERSGAAQIALASVLSQQLAQARAQLAGMGRSVSPDSPQYVALAAQVRGLEGQVAAAQSRLAGSSGSIAPGLGVYEGLRLKQQFAAKRYEAAAQALETARERSLTQQVFLVRVVEPNLPGKALHPQRLKITATVFFSLLLTYAVGWLILAGVREHAG
ncbi:capsule biosynthesis protein [Caulobacter endophyticus]|uniref:capsule biosynthesis protein n=1 Tax=Caulobacter endophyticus TaxID=2172652 RepID=UPI00240FDC73|nr:capsule biosynthesis protein [Caulobacter endophyticus]MDG2527284.1 capsule biosynthesis protein [Caulobacter endophyticus]